MSSARTHAPALVIGGGIAGLLAAAALGRRAEKVILLERDAYPQGPVARRGTPQAKHFHSLLGGGFDVINELFAGFGDDLEAHDARKLHATLDMRVERPGFDPFPQRDLGLFTYSQSRPLLEYCLARRVTSMPSVALVEARARKLTTDARGAVTGAEVDDGRTFTADLVVDATGNGVLTSALLEEQGIRAPTEDVVEVNVHYSTGIFEIPHDAPTDWKTLMTISQIPESTRGLLISPLEGGRWICGLSGRGAEQPPGDLAGFLAFCKGCRTQTAYNALRNARMVEPIIRSGFKQSVRRHFEQLTKFPDRLIPIGDVICKLNPVYGQGMSIAALEVRRLAELLAPIKLESWAAINALSLGFFAAVDEILRSPWEMNVYPDFMYPTTKGERPADIQERMAYARVLSELAAEDPAIHKAMAEVNYLIKPQRTLSAPWIRERVLERLNSARR